MGFEPLCGLEFEFYVLRESAGVGARRAGRPSWSHCQARPSTYGVAMGSRHEPLAPSDPRERAGLRPAGRDVQPRDGPRPVRDHPALRTGAQSRRGSMRRLIVIARKSRACFKVMACHSLLTTIRFPKIRLKRLRGRFNGARVPREKTQHVLQPRLRAAQFGRDALQTRSRRPIRPCRRQLRLPMSGRV